MELSASAANDLERRGQLFEAVPRSEDDWKKRRAAYIESIAVAEADGQLTVARMRAQRARQLLPSNDSRWPEVQATLERLTRKVVLLNRPLCVPLLPNLFDTCRISFTAVAPTSYTPWHAYILPCHCGSRDCSKRFFTLNLPSKLLYQYESISLSSCFSRILSQHRQEDSCPT